MTSDSGPAMLLSPLAICGVVVASLYGLVYVSCCAISVRKAFKDRAEILARITARKKAREFQRFHAEKARSHVRAARARHVIAHAPVGLEFASSRVAAVAPRRYSAVTIGGIPITHRLNLMRSTPDLRKVSPRRRKEKSKPQACPVVTPYHVVVHMPATVEEASSSGGPDGPESGLGSDVSSGIIPVGCSPVPSRHGFDSNRSSIRRRHSYDQVLEQRPELATGFSPRGGTHSAAVSPHRRPSSMLESMEVRESGVDLPHLQSGDDVEAQLRDPTIVVEKDTVKAMREM